MTCPPSQGRTGAGDLRHPRSLRSAPSVWGTCTCSGPRSATVDSSLFFGYEMKVKNMGLPTVANRGERGLGAGTWGVGSAGTGGGEGAVHPVYARWMCVPSTIGRSDALRGLQGAREAAPACPGLPLPLGPAHWPTGHRTAVSSGNRERPSGLGVGCTAPSDGGCMGD